MLEIVNISGLLFTGLFIFLARIADVTMGTIRIIFVSRGIKYLAPIIGFFEVIIWLSALGQVMQDVTNITAYIAYGAGFATGTALGMYIESKISIGKVLLRVVTKNDTTKLIEFLNRENYCYAFHDAKTHDGDVSLITIILKRNMVPFFASHLQELAPEAYYTAEDLRVVSNGIVLGNGHHFVLENWRHHHNPVSKQEVCGSNLSGIHIHEFNSLN